MKTPAIQVDHLTVQFESERILDDISFTVNQGDIVAIIGPNGSGKTTLLRTMLGLERADRGEVQIMGRPVPEAFPLIGYVPQRFSFDKEFPITVSEFLRLGARKPISEIVMAHKLEEVGLKASAATRSLGALSGGELQRVLIAQAILENPAVLFLDEANAGVDIAGEQTLLDIIHSLNQKHKTTIVMVSHEIHIVARFVNQVICLNRALVCHGAPRETLTEDMLKELFGSEIGLYDHERPHHHQEDHHSV